MKRRSRLSLFKLSSLSISLLGILMIIGTIVLFGYLGFTMISDEVSSGVDERSVSSEVASLNSQYSSLKSKSDSINQELNEKNDNALRKKYISAELELIKAKSAVDDVDSALSAKKDISVVNERIKIAKKQLDKATDSLSQFDNLINTENSTL